MYSTEQILAILEQKIASLPMGMEPHRLYDPIIYSMQEGGKRVRPVLLMMATNLYTDDINDSVAAALSVEMFHNFTLLHDDIMDNSLLRRGREAVHKKWSPNVAILSGDAMLIYAYHLLLDTKHPRMVDLMRIFNRFSLEICEGQQFDMDFEQVNEVSREQYLNMIRLKTSVLIAGGMEMGAVIGGASDDDCRRLYEFGLNIGLAFQLQDDILDAYGDSATFGKPIGGDITEGKKSYLTVRCFEVCSAEDKAEMTTLLQRKDMSRQAKIDAVKAIYDRYGVKELSQIDAERYFERAISVMADVEATTERKAQLIAYAHKLTNRKK